MVFNNQKNTMKKILSILSVSLLLVVNTGCIKGEDPCTPRSVQNEQAAMTTFATTNGINATVHTSGINYEIISQGSGVNPTLQSTLTVNYVGKYMDGSIFDQTTTTPAVFPLSNVIAGWQIILPLIQKGGRIKMIIPSSLAYGCAGYRSVPPDAILFFDVTLVDVQ